MRVKTTRGVTRLLAECEDCDFIRDEMGRDKADDARSAAKRHAASTGHAVYVERSKSTYLRGETHHDA